MAYTSPTTRTTGNLETAADFNQDVIDNITALHSGPGGHFLSNEGSDYTTTSTTMVDVDATEGKFQHTIVCDGRPVLSVFSGTGTITGTDRIYFDVVIDGVAYGGDDGLMMTEIIASEDDHNFSFTTVLDGVAAGSRIFKLQWKVGSGTGKIYVGSGASNRDIHAIWDVRHW